MNGRHFTLAMAGICGENLQSQSLFIVKNNQSNLSSKLAAFSPHVSTVRYYKHLLSCKDLIHNPVATVSY